MNFDEFYKRCMETRIDDGGTLIVKVKKAETEGRCPGLIKSVFELMGSNPSEEQINRGTSLVSGLYKLGSDTNFYLNRFR